MSSLNTGLVWFRNDLRLHDNPALTDACGKCSAVSAVYILDENSPGVRPPGGASRWWLHHSLQALREGLAKLGIPLFLKRGAAAAVIAETVQQTGAKCVYWNRRYDPGGIACDTAIKSALRDDGTDVVSFKANLLNEPFDVLTGQGTPYRVFTPYWRSARDHVSGAPPLPVPRAVGTPLQAGPPTTELSEWHLLPLTPNWASGLEQTWRPGEAVARDKLQRFIDGSLMDYGAVRDFPARNSTSLLSPHLCFGEISPRTIWHAVRHHMDTEERLRHDGEKFLSELGWREFSHHLMFHYPAMVTGNYNTRFDHFDWREDPTALSLWQRGMTGYPIVDAGLRELWTTGYMHNRVRMIVASFLTKHLRLHWRSGEEWFWDTLVDADAANNVANWQWVAGTGADAAPYFRIFNPMLQGEKFDKEGDYVRRWVPELAAMPNKFIHKPWQAPVETLLSAKVSLGTTYPHPIVDHGAARDAALDAFRSLKDG